MAILIHCFLTCCLTYWTSWCLKESHHLTHRGRTCPFALLGRAKCLFLQVKCYSVLCAFKLLRTEWKEKGKLCKFCKGSTLFPHCTNLSCYIARGCFLQGNCQSLRLSIYPIYFLCCAWNTYWRDLGGQKAQRSNPRTNEGIWGVWLRSETATLPPSNVQALYATIRDRVKKAWRTGLCGKVSKRGHLWNIMQGSCSMKALGCAGS